MIRSRRFGIIFTIFFTDLATDDSVGDDVTDGDDGVILRSCQPSNEKTGVVQPRDVCDVMLSTDENER